MSLYADLLTSVRDVQPLVVADAVVGPRFTAVAAAPGADGPPTICGVAYTGAYEGDSTFDPAGASRELAGRLHGRPLFAAAHESLEVGTAALNALLAAQRLGDGTAFGDENGLDLIARLSAGKRLAVVGAFPYLKTIRVDAVQSWVLELEPEEDHLPASAAPEVIPQADVVGITGSTLANDTLEGLLKLCRRDAFVAIIGPTTPLSPVLLDYGVDVLCGSFSENVRTVLESVAVDRSTRRIPGMRQVSLRRSDA